MDIFGIIIGLAGIALAYFQYVKSKQEQARSQNDQKNIQKHLDSLQEKHKELIKERPEIQYHHVIMDGISQSGKTTFIARLISPVISREALSKIATTAKNYTTVAFPICWEKKTKTENTLLHMVMFHDIAGEKRSTFLNALDNLSKENLKKTRVVSVIIWDISRLEENYKYLNKEIIEVTYGNNKARQIIRSIIIYFNKTDLIKDKTKLYQKIESEKHKIREMFHDLFDKGYGEIRFHDGSAIEGNGMHYCFGEIISDLNLQHNYEVITGNPFERESENI